MTLLIPCFSYYIALAIAFNFLPLYVPPAGSDPCPTPQHPRVSDAGYLELLTLGL